MTMKRAGCRKVAAVLGAILMPLGVAWAGIPYGEGNYGAGWYGYGEATLVLDAQQILVPEGTTTQLVLRLSTQPPRSQTVTVARVSGDANIGFTGSTNLAFTTNNWNQGQGFTITASVDVARLDGTATVQCASLEIVATNVTVVRSGLQGVSDADADGLANVSEYIVGSSWLDPRSTGMAIAIQRGATNLVVGFDRLLASGADYTGKTRHYRVDTTTHLVAGTWSGVPGATNITGSGAYALDVNGPDTNRFYRVKVWLTAP